MDPIAGAIVGVSTAFKVVGSIAQGNAAADQYNARGQALDYQAQAADANAQTALQLGDARETQVRRNARQVLGQQYAGQAQSGIDPNSGSAVLVRHDSEVQAELDALNTRYQSMLQARSLKQQSALDTYDAGISHASAGQARQLGYLGAGGSILGGIGDYATLRGKFGS